MEGDTLEDIDYCRNLGAADRARFGCPIVRYVNVYSVSREYGGPEEGGWWYDVGEPLASVPVFSNKEETRVLKDLEARLGVFATRDIKIKVFTEDHFAEEYPQEIPYYE